MLIGAAPEAGMAKAVAKEAAEEVAERAAKEVAEGAIVNGKGLPYPEVIVEGYGKVPFPEGPYTPNNSRILRNSFTPKLKNEFKNWWIEQGRSWPEIPEGSMLQIHHIKPLSHGGTNAFENLVPLIHPEQHSPFTLWWLNY